MNKAFLWLTFLFLVLFMIRSNVLHAQNDSLFINMAELDWKDIKINNDLSVGTKVISGSRSEKDIADLPFTIFVVTGEEIRQKGYLTLTDVLKRLPGIRVSQPGSALEGETFLMRGLTGNAYAKILINDNPIKPYTVSGLPIGAQLPIREAERIEIIYGPAATLYGADASAGVINIILKESDRPIYVQADLGFGDDGFENLDIMFSGKMGKDKRILRFKIFGNYTSFDDRRIKYNIGKLYNPEEYEGLLPTLPNYSYLSRPNYRGFAGTPFLGELPHISNALGIDLRLRKWQLSIHRYNRRDHSSIGLSPYAVSYANPLNYFGEQINTFNLSYNLKKNRFRFKTALNGINYQTNARSSSSYVSPLVSFALQASAGAILEGAGINNPVILDSARTIIDELYFSESRFSSANSTEGSLEFLFGFSPNKHIELAAGLNVEVGAGNPLRQFSPDPLDDLTDSTFLDNTFVSTAFIVGSSGFLEGYFNFGKWNAILGAQVFTRSNATEEDTPAFSFNPRLALQYRWTQNFSLRFSAGRSFRYPSPYYSATSYTISRETIGEMVTGTSLTPEITVSGEFGLRWNAGSKVKADASTYFTRTSNFLLYTLPDITEDIILGYSSIDQATADLFGIQSSITFSDVIPAIELNSTFNLTYSKGKEISNRYSFVEASQPLDIDAIRSQPTWIAQFDVEFKPFKKIRLLFENTWMTRSHTRNLLLYQGGSVFEDVQDVYNSGFYTLDALVSYQFNANIFSYVRLTNVLNKKYAGIDATDDGNGLLYNPQTKRIMRIGINYRLE